MPKIPLFVLVALLAASVACYATDTLTTSPEYEEFYENGGFPTIANFITSTVVIIEASATPTPFDITASPEAIEATPTAIEVAANPEAIETTPTETSTPIATLAPSETALPSATPTAFPTVTPEVSPMPVGYSLNIWLSPANPNDVALLQAQGLITQRLGNADLEAVLEQDAGDIRIRTNATSDQIIRLATHVGWLEIVDFSDLNMSYIPPVGTCILTTSQVEAYPNQDICAISELAPAEHPNGGPFPTLIARPQIASLTLKAGLLGESAWNLTGILTPEGADLFAQQTETRQGKLLGIVLDGELISVPTLTSPITDGRFETGLDWSATLAGDIRIILASDPLPLALTQTGSKAFPEGDADYQRP